MKIAISVFRAHPIYKKRWKLQFLCLGHNLFTKRIKFAVFMFRVHPIYKKMKFAVFVFRVQPISKKMIFAFYCVNTSYPMDNCFTGRRDRSRQMPEKDVLYRIPAGPVRRVHSPGGASYFLFLSRHGDVIASFSFGAWRVKTCFLDKRIFCSTPNATILFYF